MTQIYMNDLKEKINQLIRLEFELKTINNNVCILKEEKLKTEKEIKEIMIKENLKDKIFIVQNKKVKYNESKTYQSYSLHYLEERLNELVEDKQTVTYIVQYLKENRKTNINSEIKILDYNNE
jgi:hypothetical protein